MTSVGQLARQEHKLVDGLFKDMKTASTDEQRQKICFRVVQELSMHSAIEEEVMYPLFKDKALGEKGIHMQEHALDEHQGVKKILYDLDQTSCDPKHDQFWTRWNKLVSDVTHHVKEEEEDMLPYIEKFLSHKTLIDAGKAWADTRSRMPTRPHPSAPAGNVLGDRVLAAVDKARDMSRFGSKGDDSSEKQSGAFKPTDKQGDFNKPVSGQQVGSYDLRNRSIPPSQ